MGRVCQCHVTAMDGVEGAAKQSDVHARLVSSFPASLGKLNLQPLP
jgi:hypothetical protein